MDVSALCDEHPIPVELVLTGFGEFEGVELLQKLSLFEKLTFDETSRLGGIIQYLDVGPNQVVLDQNALGNALYIVARGECKVTRDLNGDGLHDRHEEIHRLVAGDLFGEMSLIDDMLTSARVTTVTDVRLLKLPRDSFEALLNADSQLALKIYRSFCKTLSDRLRRTTSMLTKAQAGAFVVR